jgi:hypothetical protein
VASLICLIASDFAEDGGQMQFIVSLLESGYCWRIPNPTISMASNQIMQVSLLTAAAINLNRVSDWLAGGDREKTRRSAFARMTQPLTA